MYLPIATMPIAKGHIEYYKKHLYIIIVHVKLHYCKIRDCPAPMTLYILLYVMGASTIRGYLFFPPPRDRQSSNPTLEVCIL